MKSRGKLITFEGGEGAGKSTVISFVKTKLEANGYRALQTREPGGCPFSEKVRELIMSESIEAKSELFLMLAARAQHIHEVIRPALDEGTVVLCDRFTHSTLAYQGAARGLGIQNLTSMCSFAEGSEKPALALFFDIEPKLGLMRAKNRGEQNRLDHEKLEFHEKVYAGFCELLEMKELARIDASQPLESVQEAAWEMVQGAL